MILQSFTIENLFSYKGAVTFDLAPRYDASRPIVVVQARNGQGKTNFLVALKLALGGLTDHLRANTAGDGRTLSHNGFIWGEGSRRWEGILNRQSRLAQGDAAHYGVALTLRQGADTVVIRRSWPAERPYSGAYGGKLVVTVNQQRLHNEEQAKDLVHQLMSETMIPYFIFDGELVQRLGVLSGESLQNDAYGVMELNLLARLTRELTGLAKDWSRAAAHGDVLVSISKLESTLTQNQARTKQLKEEQSSLNREKSQAEKELESIRRRLNTLEDAPGTDRAVLNEQVKIAEDTLKGFIADLYQDILPLAPLHFAGPLLVRARDHVAQQLHESQSQDSYASLRPRLKAIPDQLLDPRAWGDHPLLPVQQDLLRVRAQDLLDAVLPPVPPPRTGAWQGLSRASAESTLRALDQHGSPSLAETSRDRLLHLVVLQREHRALAERLESTTDLSQQQKEERRHLRSELERLNQVRSRAEAELDRVHKELVVLGQERGRVEGKLAEDQADLARRQGVRSRAGLAQRAADFTQGFTDKAIASRRARLNTKLNEHFQTLFSSSQQVGRLELDQDLYLHLYTVDGRRVEPQNLSAGMRQIVGVALLWSLQDAAKHTFEDGSPREIPVVIDTPIARLDLQHQEKVLFDYLPQASRQVILLPTDAELNKSRFARLAPHISHAYTLHNPSGEATSAKPLALPDHSV